MKKRFFYLLTLLIAISNLAAEKEKSLLSTAEWISDWEARLQLAEIYSYRKHTYASAISEYHKLEALQPNNPKILLALARLYTSTFEFATALEYLTAAREQTPSLELPAEQRPSSPYLIPFSNEQASHGDLQELDSILDLQVQLAVLEASLGYASLSKARFEKITLFDKRPKSNFAKAHAFKSWGDFYRAEEFFRNLSTEAPFEGNLAVVDTFFATDRHDEAEKYYLKLQQQYPQKTALLLSKRIEIKNQQHNYAAGLKLAKEWLKLESSSEALLTAAALLFQMGRYEEALSYYQEIDDPDYTAEIALQMGRCHQKLGCHEWAKTYLSHAYSDLTKQIPAKFHLHGDAVFEDGYVEELLTENLTSQELNIWAGLYAEQGSFYLAEKIYYHIATLDPSYFPAQIGLAEAYSGQFMLEQALYVYSKQLELFPDHFKLLQAQARVLSWNKEYETSICHYNHLINLNPGNPIPRLERARVAYWGKSYAQAMEYYGELVKDLRDQDLPLLRKKIALEIKTQRYKWNKRPRNALKSYQELLEVDPGSDYWQFESGQSYCNLGLCDRSKRIYDNLLQASPSNSLAGLALDRQMQLASGNARLDYNYWNERGYGELSQIGRYEINLTARYPISCRQHLSFSQRHWIEHTFFDDRYHPADGQTLEWNHRFNSLINASAAVTRKQYTHRRFGTLYSCFWRLQLNFWDRAEFDMGFRNQDILYNYFNLKQKTQQKIWWVGLQSSLTHSLEMNTLLEYCQYNDRNSLSRALAIVSYRLTEHPRAIKLDLTAEYRNTAKTNRFIYSADGELINIIYPYWAPQDYFAGQLLLEWRHDYGDLEFCEAPVRFYDIKIAGGTDTQNNPYWSIKGEWQHELYSHWKFTLAGIIHRSPLWNAKGLWCNVAYQF